jgi:hypothetical protein
VKTWRSTGDASADQLSRHDYRALNPIFYLHDLLRKSSTVVGYLLETVVSAVNRMPASLFMKINVLGISCIQFMPRISERVLVKETPMTNGYICSTDAVDISCGRSAWVIYICQCKKTRSYLYMKRKFTLFSKIHYLSSTESC